MGGIVSRNFRTHIGMDVEIENDGTHHITKPTTIEKGVVMVVGKNRKVVVHNLLTVEEGGSVCVVGGGELEVARHGLVMCAPGSNFFRDEKSVVRNHRISNIVMLYDS